LAISSDGNYEEVDGKKSKKKPDRKGSYEGPNNYDENNIEIEEVFQMKKH
jgi:hypothetical protein